jgi:hypothetical protein
MGLIGGFDLGVEFVDLAEELFSAAEGSEAWRLGSRERQCGLGPSALLQKGFFDGLHDSDFVEEAAFAAADGVFAACADLMDLVGDDDVGADGDEGGADANEDEADELVVVERVHGFSVWG